MLKDLKVILEIQELDMKMIRLMRLKKDRQNELGHIESLREDLKQKKESKKEEIKELEKEIKLLENSIVDIKSQLKKLEAKQGSIKKVEEFNALTKEMSSKERERITTEQKTSDLIDKKNIEEEILKKIDESLLSSEESSKALELEIKATIKKLNEEGRVIKKERDELAKKAPPEILKIYMRLLNNKKDRVVVPLENRVCSGCHIALTAQHENLVRKVDRLVFCEHCSRILYWQEPEVEEGKPIKKRRRRKKASY
jgi:predicted  nucleic acid-binding Zn-ribbon protein